MLDIPTVHELRERLKAMPIDTFCASAEQVKYQMDTQKSALQAPNPDITQLDHDKLFDKSIDLANKALIYLDELQTRLFDFPPNAPITQELMEVIQAHREITEELTPTRELILRPSFTQAIFNRFWCPIGVSYVPEPTTSHTQLIENHLINPLTTPTQFATLYELLSICAHLDRDNSCKNDMWVSNIIRIVEDTTLTEKEKAAKIILTQDGRISHLIICREHYRYDLMDDTELVESVSPLSDISDSPVQQISSIIAKYGKPELSKRFGAHIRRLKDLDVRDFHDGIITTRVLDLAAQLFDFQGAIQNYQTDTCWYLANIFVAILETEPYILSRVDIFSHENVTAQRLLTLSYITEWILHHPSLFAHYPYRVEEIKEFYTNTLSETIPILLAKPKIDRTSLLYLKYSIEAIVQIPNFVDKKIVLETVTQQITEEQKDEYL